MSSDNNKNAYETRLDILRLAFEIATNEFSTRVELASNKALATGATQPVPCDPVGVDHILAIANRLNQFISSKGQGLSTLHTTLGKNDMYTHSKLREVFNNTSSKLKGKGLKNIKNPLTDNEY